MSAIFISHSSADNDAAIEVTDWLAAQGHRSMFLDFDPADGIPAGRDWERELYAQLRMCRAIIVLCSPASMASEWCFAEITHGKALGKHIFPVRIAPCDIHSVLTDVQVIELAAGRRQRDQAFERLLNGLRIAGLDPQNLFDWDGSRAPYPGLVAFQPADAATFFGRDEAVREGLDVLHRLRRFGGPRTLLILGSSGSGKSSLMRAGVLPRLARDGENWQVVGPFRPLSSPRAELAKGFSDAFRALGQTVPARDIEATFNDEDSDDRAQGSALIAVCEALRESAGERQATVLLALDQAEEILNSTPEHEAARFLSWLKAAIRIEHAGLMLVATMRSDFLGDLQRLPAARGLDFESISLGPLSAEDFAQMIEGPARLAALELGPGLVQAMVTDTETDNALPLLAFTLRELWERYGRDHRLTVEEYRDGLGGLEGSVRYAAQAVMASVIPADSDESARTMTADLRAAFVSMVQLNDAGRYVRRPARWKDLPESSRTVLDRFVDARLLVTGSEIDEPTVEVAHESLFHAWGTLKGWLDEDREFLLWRRRLQTMRDEWDSEGRPAYLLLREARLTEACRWADERAGDLVEHEHEYVSQSRALEQSHRRQRDARRRRVFAVITATAAGFAALLAVAMHQWSLAEKERDVVRAREIAGRAASRLRSDPELGVLLAMDAVRLAQGTPAASLVREVLREALLQSKVRAALEVAGTAFTGVAFSPDGAVVAAANDDNHVYLWRWGADGAACPRAGCKLAGHSGPVLAVSFSADGRYLLSASRDLTAIVWDVAAQEPLAVLAGHREHVHASHFSPDGTLVTTASGDGTARVWAWQTAGDEGSASPWVLDEHDADVTTALFTPDGHYIVTTSKDHTAQFWNVATRRSEGLLIAHDAPIQSAAVTSRCAVARKPVAARGDAAASETASSERSVEPGASSTPRDGACATPVYRLVTGGSDNLGRVWEWSPGDRDVNQIGVLTGHKDTLTGVDISADGARVVSSSWDGTARIWTLEHAPLVSAAPEAVVRSNLTTADSPRWRLRRLLLGHRREVTGAGFSPDERHVVTSGRDGTARIRDARAEQSLEVLRGHDGTVRSADFSPDGRMLISAGDDNKALLWRRSDRHGRWLFSGIELRHDDSVQEARFSPDGRKILTASLDDRAKVWPLLISDDGTLESVGEALELIHDDDVLDARFDETGAYVITASDDGSVLIWDADTTERVALGADEGVAKALAPFVGTRPSPGGEYVVQGIGESSVRVWDARSGEVARMLDGHTDPVTDVAFNADGTRLATASADGTAQLWRFSPNSTTFERGARVDGHGAAVLSVGLDASGERVVTGSLDETARVWDAGTGEALSPALEHCVGVLDARFGDGGTITTVGQDHILREWTWSPTTATARCPGGDAECVSTSCAHRRHASRALFSPDGRHALSTSRDSSVYLYDRRTGERLQVLRGHEDSVVAAAFSPDGSHLATASADHTVIVWSVDASRGVWTPAESRLRHGGAVSSVTFSPDGSRIATASDDHLARVWSRGAGRWGSALLLDGHQDAVSHAMFDATGRQVVTASRDGTARVWDAATGEAIAVLPGHSDWVTSAGFSPDGSLVVTTSRDRTTRLWARAPGDHLERSASRHRPGACTALDGVSPLYCELCGDEASLLAIARQCVTRELTAEERRRYLDYDEGFRSTLRNMYRGM